jgi:hypothetical protein
MYNYIYRIVDLLDHSNCFESDNLIDVMHEFISLLLTKSFYDYEKVFVLKIKDCGSNKKFPFITNTFKYNHIEKRIYDNDHITFTINNKNVLGLFNKLNNINPSSNNILINKQNTINKKKNPFELIKETHDLLSNKEIILNTTSVIPDQTTIDQSKDVPNDQTTEKLDEDNNSEISDKIELLKEQLDKLNELKEQQLDIIDDAKDKLEDDRDKLTEYYCNISSEKRMLRIQKQKEEEKQRIFEADKKVYEKIKIDIIKERISEDNLPELFINKYPIFKFMDLNNLLDTDNDYDTYKSLYDEMYPPEKKINDPYVQHNVHYQKENKSIPSVDEILADLESDESDDSDKSNDTESMYKETNNNDNKFSLASALLTSLK